MEYIGERERTGEALLILLSLVVSFVCAEIGYRAFQYITLPARIISLQAGAGPGAYAFDPHTGYRYKPNYAGNLAAPYNSRWRSNSHGHISAENYPRQKPVGEYRIAVIGDSFTAAITSNLRWTEVLSEQLNASPEWKSATSGKTTRVINLGIDGTGFVQFAGISRYHTTAFQPDLVIVNFVMDDFWRKQTYRAAPENIGDLDRYVRLRFLERINWFGLRPELIAATVGRYIGLASKIPLDAASYVIGANDLRYKTRSEALWTGTDAIKSILEDFPKAIFLHAPLKQELERRPYPEWNGFLEEIASALPAFRSVAMGDAFGTGPFKTFFIPDDAHYTDEGNKVYGEAVARWMIMIMLRSSDR